MTQPDRSGDLNSAIAGHYQKQQAREQANRQKFVDQMRADVEDAVNDPLLGLRSADELDQLSRINHYLRTHGDDAA